jgi:hypothetical protein
LSTSTVAESLAEFRREFEESARLPPLEVLIQA